MANGYYWSVTFSLTSYMRSTYTIYGAITRPQAGPPCNADSTIAGYVRLGTCWGGNKTHQRNKWTNYLRQLKINRLINIVAPLPFSVCTVHSVIVRAYECNTYKWCQSQWYWQIQPHNLIEKMPLALPKFPCPMNLLANGSVCQHFCNCTWMIYNEI